MRAKDKARPPLLPKTKQKLQTWLQGCGFVLLPSQEQSPALILASAQLATPAHWDFHNFIWDFWKNLLLQFPDLAQGCHNIEIWIRDLATLTRAKKPKSHPSPAGLGEASTHNQNNEYFEVTYERHASESGVQQKKGNKKEISIGTILPGRQISQCL